MGRGVAVDVNVLVGEGMDVGERVSVAVGGGVDVGVAGAFVRVGVGRDVFAAATWAEVLVPSITSP